MKVFIALVLLALVAFVIMLGYSLDDTTLSADEQQQALAACVRCHGADPHRGEEDDHELSQFEDISDCIRCHGSIHDRHRNADCMRCHSGADGLESADNAHDTLQWVGFGVLGAVVAGLGVNFTVARFRLGRNGGSLDDR